MLYIGDELTCVFVEHGSRTLAGRPNVRTEDSRARPRDFHYTSRAVIFQGGSHFCEPIPHYLYSFEKNHFSVTSSAKKRISSARGEGCQQCSQTRRLPALFRGAQCVGGPRVCPCYACVPLRWDGARLCRFTSCRHGRNPATAFRLLNRGSFPRLRIRQERQGAASAATSPAISMALKKPPGNHKGDRDETHHHHASIRLEGPSNRAIRGRPVR